MDINWSKIKSEMLRDLSSIFSVGTPAYNDVEKGIDLFKKVIYADIQRANLGGLIRTIPQSLHEGYVSSIGEIAPLKILADNLEAYLKKIAIIANLDTPANIIARSLMPILKLLNLNSALSAQSNGGYPVFNQANLDSFKGTPEYLYYLCDSYLLRNKVHEAPDYGRIEVLTKINSLLVVYIYAAKKYEREINSISSITPTEEIITNKISGEQQYLYDFISFGNSTYRIKNQIVSSYVLYTIKQNIEVTIQDIRERSNAYFQNELGIGYYQMLITELQQAGRIVFNKENKLFSLSPIEYKRLDDNQANFEENRIIFFKLLEDVLRDYGVSQHISNLFDRLQEFIQTSYSVDIAEAVAKGELTSQDQNESLHEFIDYLQSLLLDKTKHVALFQDLIVLSKESDFLIRMCASKAFAKLTNPDRFEQYIHQQEKIVYLDTQIILHALCLNYLDKGMFKNIYYSTVEELIDIVQKNSNIKLKVSRLYLQEVAHQLKMALLLIPFDSNTSGRFSSNVFYQFYYYLKKNDLNHEDDSSFSEFMFNWFGLTEDDTYDPKFGSIVFEQLHQILSDGNLKIDVEVLPTYENKADAVDIMRDVLMQEEHKEKPINTISNDAIMMLHLSNSDVHIMEPFFLTWDKLFTKYRRAFLKKYGRNKLISFHLFSPARFINHLSLIKLRINPTAIANDFLSYIETLDLQENTQTIWDVVNKFTNIDSINSNQRRRYITKLKEILESELNYSIEDMDEDARNTKIVIPFEDILGKINDYFNGQAIIKINEYRRMLLTEDFYNEMTKLISKQVVSPEPISNLYEHLEDLIRLFKPNKSV